MGASPVSKRTADVPGFGKVFHQEYDSAAAFVAALPTHNNTHGGRTFCGGLGFDEAKRACAVGSLDAVTEANRMIEQVELEGLMTGGAAQWEQAIAGAFPCVPAYLANIPECMLARVECEAVTAPVRVFLDCCAAAGITADQMRTRGTAALALVLALSGRRPVELYVYASLGAYGGCVGAVPLIRIETRPLDVAAASFALAHAAFLRRLCFSWGYDGREFNGGWAFGCDTSAAQHRTGMRALLGATDQDVVLYGPSYGDREIIDKPMDWLRKQLAAHFDDASE
jgi:hypothetical protein